MNLQSLNFKTYLAPANIDVGKHKAMSGKTFLGQKNNIQRLLQALRPKKVVCLGAGYLNDIPTEDLIEGDADIYFAEWMHDVTEASFKNDLVRQIEVNFVCMACKATNNPEKYCKNYMEWDKVAPNIEKKSDNYCSNFEISENVMPLCMNFAPGEFPQFFEADVSGGKALQFSKGVSKMVERAKNPGQAFRFAIKKTEHLKVTETIPLEDHTVDFITSSMVVSQFDFEPYTFFIRNVMRRFGGKAVEQDMKVIENFEETLRNNLFLAQLEGHCMEMLRLLKPDGRIYFSIETMHRNTCNDPWFQVEVAPKAMSFIGKHFFFDIDTLPEVLNAEHVPTVKQGESIIQSHVLVPQN